ncbi:hypothetical protein PAXRUDRAFT_409549 [Paxillus rubicundulus Ve08.2h10]|uniref:Uncharacterized protein n=1 Tax=Paxillus rubicundulus Ve08.2h10 TaxID=930991 RepID=A0A0D0CNJ6_9AGAM|nr:hypothetical protein PAXRUDRAFT_409549 [Paxillus rubicundulus Ve08.2h10]
MISLWWCAIRTLQQPIIMSQGSTRVKFFGFVPLVFSLSTYIPLDFPQKNHRYTSLNSLPMAGTFCSLLVAPT